MKKNKIICIIPARGGSKGLKNKNIRYVDGHPLIAYVIALAIRAKIFDAVLVSTDNKKIAQISKKYGAKVPFLREKKYAQDLTTTEATLQNALNVYETQNSVKFDICVYMTATDIFRQVSDIKKAVNILKKNKNVESVFSVRPTHKNFWYRNKSAKYERILKSMKDYSSRQIKKPIFREDTGIVCASRAYLWRQGRRIGDNIKIIINKNPIDIDIHDDYDMFLVRKTFEYFKKNNKNFLPQIY
tara:strand:- start:5099 stop:5827 length:729 start_codon:yes stop_codon:yes gene_type:complete